MSRKIFLALTVLIFVFAFTACSDSNTTTHDSNGSAPNTNIDTSASENTLTPTSDNVWVRPPYSIGPIERVTLDAELQNILNTAVYFSEDSNIHMQNFLRNVYVHYQDSEIFGFDEALARYHALPPFNVQSSEFIVNNRIDTNRLRTQILSNNRDFLYEHVNTPLGNFYAELSHSDFERIFEIFVYALQFRLDAGDIAYAGRLDKNLTDLKILSSLGRPGVAYAGVVYTDLNMVAVRLNHPSFERQDINFMKHLIIHEAIHYIQMAFGEELEIRDLEARFGFAYVWDDLAINSLHFMWYIEGATEQLAMETYGTFTPTWYEREVRDLESMTLALILRENVYPLTLASLTFQEELMPLFTVFGAYTPNQQKEILNMMFAREILFGGDNRRDFQRVGGNSSWQFEFGLRASIAQTLTKTFYSSLAERISTAQTTIEEVFWLISLFEADLNRQLRYAGNDRLPFNRDFIDNYVLIQNEFFGLLAEESGIDFEHIIRAYNAFSMTSLASTINISFLDNTEREFIKRIAIGLQGDRTHSVQSVHASIILGTE